MENDTTLEADLAADRRVATAMPAGRDLVARLARVGIESRLFKQPSQVVSVGKYEIQGELGTGGMGVVYRAHDPELERPVALKLLHTARASSADADKAKVRLLREARAMARLTHPNVLTVHEVGTFEEQVFVAMEFIEGETLDAWLAKESRPWTEVLPVFIQAARGLAAAHEEGIIHRDFKPQNVMLSNRGRARVLDFGLARSLEAPPEPVPAPADNEGAATLTRTGALVGTPAYMAPEQYSGHPVDARSDQFSFCVALWEAVFGRRPFRGGTVAAIADAVTSGTLDPPPQGRAPGWLRRAIARGLRVEPNDRYGSMSALIDALEAGQRESRLRRWLPALAAVAVLATAGVIAWPSDQPPETVSPRGAPSVAAPVPEPETKTIPVTVPVTVPAKSEPPPEPAPKPETKRPRPKPVKPKYTTRWCYYTQDKFDPIKVPFENQSIRKKFDHRGQCWECRVGSEATRNRVTRADCEGFAICHHCET